MQRSLLNVLKRGMIKNFTLFMFILFLPFIIKAQCFTKIAVGQAHTIALKSDGSLWSWGLNNSGQLGLGNTTSVNTPTRIGTGNNWVSIAAGNNTTMAIKADGTLWGWGNSFYGQLGLGAGGSGASMSSPTQIGTSSNWAEVSEGNNFTLAVKTDGTLWAWGQNSNYQLGDGTTNVQYYPVQIGTARNWKTVSAGIIHSVALKTDGTLWAWGNNGNSQLGDGTTVDKFTPTQIGTAANWAAISSGWYHVLATKTDNTLWGWGGNFLNQLGNGNTTNRSTPAQIGTATYSSIAAGYTQSVAVKTDGTLWAWGENSKGQLGDGTTTTRTTPVQIGSATWKSAFGANMYFTVGIQSNNSLWAAGLNDNGQLGDGTATQRNAFTQISGSCNSNANLSSLSISSGTIRPFVYPVTTSYTATVFDPTTSVTVTPTCEDNTSTVTVNGTTVTSGSASSTIPLSLGANTITVVVTAASGATKTYTLSVTRNAAASTDATLSALVPSTGTLSPTFSASTLSYTVSVSNGTTGIAISPTVNQADATVTVNGAPVTSANPSNTINLNVGVNTITTTVTAQDGITTKNYTVAVTRRSTDATLSALTFSAGTLNTTFTASNLKYYLYVPNANSTVTVTPTVNQANATVKVNNVSVTSGTASSPLSLTVGSNNTFTILVTSQDNTTQTYTVFVVRSVAAPSITYTAGNKVYKVNTAITSLTPTNAGGPIGFEVSTVAGVSYQSTYINGAASSATFYGPYGMVTDASGNIFVSDNRNNVIRKITPGGVVSTFAGSGTAGSTNGTGLSATFNGPTGITIDASGNLYVVDAVNAIRKITPAGVVTTLATGFSRAYGIAIDANGNLYVADQWAHSIKKVTPAGVVSVLAGSGTAATVNGTGTGASFNYPTGVTVDASGNVFATENSGWCVRKITPAGVTSTLAGGSASAFADGQGTAAQFASPQGISIDANGNMYVADYLSNRIRKVTAGGLVSTIGGNGTAGGADGALSISNLHFPSSTAVAQNGDVYFSDATNTIRKISLVGKYSISPALPTGLSFDTLTGVISGTPTALSPATNYVVTAVNGSGTSTYTLNITVASSDANLSALSLNSGTLSPAFSSSTTSYTASVPFIVSSIRVTPTASQANATIQAKLAAGTFQTVASGSESTNLNGGFVVGNNTINVFVTAQDGTTTKTYSVVVTRAAATTDATLSALTISSGTLSPSFVNTTTSYTASVSNAISSITVTPTSNQTTSVTRVNGTTVARGSASNAIALNVGNNTITVLVTAPDGTSTSTYTITVNRAPSTDATLASLTLSSGSYSPAFAANTTAYTTSVGVAYNTITVTPTVNEANATILVNGTTVISGAASSPISLNVGSNTITVLVTAQDGTTTKTYTFTINKSGGIVWTGAVNNAWSTAGNWAGNTVPNSSNDITIPSNPVRQPILGSDLTVANIQLDGNLSLNGKKLTITGAINGSGKLRGSATSALIVNSSLNNTLNFGSGNDSLLASLTLSGTGTVTLGSGLGIVSQLNLSAGTLNTANRLTLKSTSIVNSAVVAPVGASAAITGNVTVERFVPKAYRAYRDFAPQVFNAGSIFNNWQEGGSYAKAGYGLFITGTTTSNANHGVDATTGLDQTLNRIKSAYTYTSGTWNSIDNTKSTDLNPFAGYRLLVRGDRSFNLFTSPISTVGTSGALLMFNATALRATGKLVTGNVVYSKTGVTNSGVGSTYNNASFGLNSATNDGFSLIANPYVAPIDWKNIYDNGRAVNLLPSYYYLDPTIGSAGAYVAYNALTNVASNLAAGARYIQAGQAVFVQNNASTSPTLTITEADKAIASTKTSVFGATVSNSKLAIDLMKQTDADWKKMDASVVVFDSHFSNEVRAEDAKKMTNNGENLSFLNGGQLLSIEGRQPAKAGDVLPLSLEKMTTNTYALQIDASAFQANGLTANLVDAYTNTTTTLKAGENQISFQVDAAKAATYTNRFTIVFKAATMADNAILVPTKLNIYPNPLVGKTLAVSIGNEVAVGKYVVSLYNSLGQKVQESIIRHSGANAAQTITTSSKLAAGIYNISVQSAATQQVVATTTLAVE